MRRAQIQSLGRQKDIRPAVPQLPVRADKTERGGPKTPPSARALSEFQGASVQSQHFGGGGGATSPETTEGRDEGALHGKHVRGSPGAGGLSATASVCRRPPAGCEGRAATPSPAGGEGAQNLGERSRPPCAPARRPYPQVGTCAS